MTDDRDSYFFALKMIRLRALLTGERWPQPEDEFSLVDAAALARIIDRQHARTA